MCVCVVTKTLLEATWCVAPTGMTARVRRMLFVYQYEAPERQHVHFNVI